MNHQSAFALPPERVIESYIATRGASSAPIYISHAIRAIRTAFPDCAMDDRALGNLVAETAIRTGHSVAFDAPA